MLSSTIITGLRAFASTLPFPFPFPFPSSQKPYIDPFLDARLTNVKLMKLRNRYTRRDLTRLADLDINLLVSSRDFKRRPQRVHLHFGSVLVDESDVLIPRWNGQCPLRRGRVVPLARGRVSCLKPEWVEQGNRRVSRVGIWIPKIRRIPPHPQRILRREAS